MIAVVRDWFLARSRREQHLLLLMAAIGVPLLAWLIVIRPIDRAYDSALGDQLQAVDRNGRVKMLAALPKAASPAALAPGSDLTLIVAGSAGEAGIALETNTATGPSTVTVSVGASSPTALAQWLRVLEGRGLRVEELRLTPAGPGTATLTARIAEARA